MSIKLKYMGNAGCSSRNDSGPILFWPMAGFMSRKPRNLKAQTLRATNP